MSDAGCALRAPEEPAPPAASLLVIVRRFWPHLRPFLRPAAAVLAASLVTPAVEAAAVWLFKTLVDGVLVPRDLHALAPLALAYLGLTVAGGAVGFVSGYLSTAISERFLLRLRTGLFAHVQRLPLDFLDRRRLGDLLSRLTGDIAAIESFLLSGAIDAAVDAVRVLFFAGALVLLDLRLALLSFVVIARGTDAIVENGQSKWVILSPKDATPTESFAAAELSKYIEAMVAYWVVLGVVMVLRRPRMS